MDLNNHVDNGKNRPLGEHEYTVKCDNPLPSEDGTPDHYWGDSSSHPPSYDSIFGQFQDTTDGGGNSLEYFKSAVFMFLGTAGCTFSLMMVLAIPMSMILVGAKFKDDCPVEPFIPVYLIVAGSFGMIKTIIVIMQGLLYTGEVFPGRSGGGEKQSDERPFAWVFLDGCLNLFLFTWFVAGNVWVYSHYKPHFSPPPHEPYNYCNPTLYLFSFWVITISYMIVGLLCLCTCCLGLCASCTAYLVTSSSNPNTT
jgi:hypothetical protein